MLRRIRQQGLPTCLDPELKFTLKVCGAETRGEQSRDGVSDAGVGFAVCFFYLQIKS